MVKRCWFAYGLVVAANPMRKLTAPTAVALMMSAGCVGQGSINIGDKAHLWQGTGTVTGPGTFVTEQCPRVKTCTMVMMSNEPPGDEAYSFVYKVTHRALVGIPYGEEPVTVYVIGDKAECEKQSAPFKLSSDPNDRCRGPFWIRR